MNEHEEIFYLGVSLAIGLLIGTERGWKKREAAEGKRIAGIRTYTLIGLLGGVAALVSLHLSTLILGFTFLGLVVVVMTAYVINSRTEMDVGITSVIASLLTFVLGALAVLGHVAVAASTAVVTALILSYKPIVHHWISKLESEELKAALMLLLISVVLLPTLPNRGFGPWQSLNPYVIWWMVVLVALISFVGYFTIKIAGTKKGILFTSLFAGLVSSTALTLHFSRMARHRQDLVNFLALGILFACGTMFPRMLLLASIVNQKLFNVLLLPSAVMSFFIYIPGIIMWRIQEKDTSEHSAPIQNPLELSSAIRFGLFLAAIMLLAEALKEVLGNAGLLLLSAVSGIADVDAITLSLAQLSNDDLLIKIAVTGIVIAAAVNSVIKALMATGIGGVKLGVRVTVPLVVAALVGLFIVWWMNW